MSSIRVLCSFLAAAVLLPCAKADDYTPFVPMNWSLFANLGSTTSFAFLPHIDGETGEILRFAVSSPPLDTTGPIQSDPFSTQFVTASAYTFGNTLNTAGGTGLLIWSPPDPAMLANFAAAAPLWSDPPVIDFSTGLPEPYDPATAGLDGEPIPEGVDPGIDNGTQDPNPDAGIIDSGVTGDSPEAVLATLPSNPPTGALAADLEVSAVPEPGTMGLCLIGIASAIAYLPFRSLRSRSTISSARRFVSSGRVLRTGRKVDHSTFRVCRSTRKIVPRPFEKLPIR